MSAMRALLLPVASGANRRCLASSRARNALLATPAATRRATTGTAALLATTVISGDTSHLHDTAKQGPQPETLFRPDAGSLAGAPATSAAAHGGAGEPLKEGEFPGFGSLPHPEYGEPERPQEQTEPEPDNPLPEGLPPNHPQREGEEAPDRPGPMEVPMPRRGEPDLPSTSPPDIVPAPGPPEVPQSPPSELPGISPGLPEFTPGAPSEMPQRGGSEINFP